MSSILKVQLAYGKNKLKGAHPGDMSRNISICCATLVAILPISYPSRPKETVHFLVINL